MPLLSQNLKHGHPPCVVSRIASRRRGVHAIFRQLEVNGLASPRGRLRPWPHTRGSPAPVGRYTKDGGEISHTIRVATFSADPTDHAIGSACSWVPDLGFAHRTRAIVSCVHNITWRLTSGMKHKGLFHGQQPFWLGGGSCGLAGTCGGTHGTNERASKFYFRQAGCSRECFGSMSCGSGR